MKTENGGETKKGKSTENKLNVFLWLQKGPKENSLEPREKLEGRERKGVLHEMNRGTYRKPQKS